MLLNERGKNSVHSVSEEKMSPWPPKEGIKKGAYVGK